MREEHEALQARREEQQPEAFQARYAARSCIESTHAPAIRRCGLRQCRYLGLAKTHLQHVLTAVAINVIRIDDWWEGHAGTDAAVPLRRSPDACGGLLSVAAEFARIVSKGTLIDAAGKFGGTG